MTTERLQRVLWRLRTETPRKGLYTNPQLKKAIMNELGTDPRTYKTNRLALIQLGWINRVGKTQIRLTNKDISETG